MSLQRQPIAMQPRRCSSSAIPRISRVMARYFAGDIDVNSIPGQACGHPESGCKSPKGHMSPRVFLRVLIVGPLLDAGGVCSMGPRFCIYKDSRLRIHMEGPWYGLCKRPSIRLLPQLWVWGSSCSCGLWGPYCPAAYHRFEVWA